MITSAGAGTGERPGTGARRPSSPEPAASWSLSPGVRAYLRCAENRGPTTRFAGARGEDAAGGLSLILPRNRPRSCRGILTNGKRTMAIRCRRKGEKESRVEVEEPFRRCFEGVTGCFYSTNYLPIGISSFLLQYLHININ